MWDFLNVKSLCVWRWSWIISSLFVRYVFAFCFLPHSPQTIEFELECGNIRAGKNYIPHSIGLPLNSHFVSVFLGALLGKMAQDIFRCHISLGVIFSHTHSARRAVAGAFISLAIYLSALFSILKKQHTLFRWTNIFLRSAQRPSKNTALNSLLARAPGARPGWKIENV